MITILCSGSRGDVQPYIALAQQLQLLGKDVQIAVGKSFEPYVRSYGIDVVPIDADLENAGIDPLVLEQARSADSVLKMFASFHALRTYGILMVEEYHNACLGSEAIIYHPGVSIGYFMAQKLQIPGILASPFPLHRTKERKSIVVYGKRIAKLTPPGLSYIMVQTMLWIASQSSLKTFWKQTYGSLPKPFTMPFEKQTTSKNPSFISSSDSIFPRPKD